MAGKKGQAAMEFLMTYGWAILAAIVVIGALALMGVFSPSVPQVCTVTAPFALGAGDCKMSELDGGISLALRNGAGEKITVSTIEIAGCGTYSTSTEFEDGEKLSITVPCSLTTLAEGDKFSGKVTVNYQRTGAEYPEVSTGQVSGTVAA